jgi:regulator of sigma E protease
MDVLKGIFALLVILSLLVVAHELGHFLFAKLFRMRVDDFSIFFGKTIWRIGKWGDTEYNVRSIPVGGFVRIAGMEPEELAGGQSLLTAVYTGNVHTEEGMRSFLEQMKRDSMVDISADRIGEKVRTAVAESVSPEGTLIAERRADLRSMLSSPQLTSDEHHLIELLLAADERSQDTGLYMSKPIYQRALAIFGGPLFSLLFGWLLFCVMGFTVGFQGDKQTSVVQDVPADGAARAAGIRMGDRITAIDGQPFSDGRLIVEKIRSSIGVPLRFSVDRGGRAMEFTITPKAKQLELTPGKPQTVGMIGIMLKGELVRLGVVESFIRGTRATGNYFRMFFGIFQKGQVRENVGGPLAMGQMAIAGQKLGLDSLMQMCAALSLSLFIINLLPIPVLDGGHLLLLALEKVRRRHLTPREVSRAQMIGFGIIAMIFCFVMVNDITRIVTGQGMQ